MEITKGQIGPEANYELKFEGGVLKASVKYQGAEMAAGMELNYSVEAVLDAVKKAIPGQVDDAVIDILKVALKAA